MSKARLAGGIFKGAKKLLGQGSKVLGIDEMSNVDKFLRFGPDAGFAVMNAVQTPGDLTDKLIAGTTDFVGSAGTGLVAAAPFKGSRIAGGVDMVGSIAGMYGGMAVSDRLQAGKDKLMGGEGLSAYERSNVEYEEQLRAAVIQEMADKGMLNPNIRGLLPSSNQGVV